MYEKQQYILLHDLDVKVKKELKSSKAIIAGGAIRSVFSGGKISDYDLYFPDMPNLLNFRTFLENTYLMRPIASTENALTYVLKNGTVLQLIRLSTMFYEDNVKIRTRQCKIRNNVLDKFDFTVCMGAYDFQNNEFVFGDRFIEDVARRDLIYNIGGEYPIASLIRVVKYMHKGYTMSNIEILKLALSINNLKIIDYKDLRKQLVGVDTAMLEPLTEKMLEGRDMSNEKYDFQEALDFIAETLDLQLEKVLGNG